jgi:pyruvate,water dikinase
VDPRVTPIPLARADDERLFGGKAVSLGTALRAGLPVPGGFALSVALVDDIAVNGAQRLADFIEREQLPSPRVAVRSSAVGEDSKEASFAGQHATHLNVRPAGLVDAVRAVWASGRSESALAYRAQRGIAGAPAVAVVVQQLIEPVSAGVLFTRNPLTGADERLIEAAWGLGEAVVAGRIVPDQFRLDAHGRVLEQVPGDKDVEILHDDDQGVREVALPSHRRYALSLTQEHLHALFDLSERCRRLWGPDLDLEWAIDRAGACHLLQSRPITTRIAGA